jgi:hypothetical protein
MPLSILTQGGILLTVDLTVLGVGTSCVIGGRIYLAQKVGFYLARSKLCKVVTQKVVQSRSHSLGGKAGATQ